VSPKGVRPGLYPADDHNPVLTGPGEGEGDVVTSGAEPVGQELAASTCFRLGEDQDVFVAPSKPGKLAPGTFLGRVADIEGQQGEAASCHVDSGRRRWTVRGR